MLSHIILRQSQKLGLISSRSISRFSACLQKQSGNFDNLVPLTNEDGHNEPPIQSGSIIFDPSSYPTIPGSEMKCLVKREPTRGMWLEKKEIPQIKDDEILIKVRKASICGTDLHIYKWDDWSRRNVPTPMTVGHEYVGVVEEMGKNVKGFTIGQRVTGEGHITCGVCRNCRAGKRHLCPNTLGVGVNRPGAFAEYLAIPAVNAFPLPDRVTDEFASIMDPLGNAVHTALSFDLVGEDVLITGAGPIGCMAAAVCKQVGARHVVVSDINDYRLELAKACGADLTINVREGRSEDVLREAMNALGMTEGFDVGLEMSGTQSGLRDLIRVASNGAKISILGIPAQPFPIDLDLVVFKGLFLKGIYGREMFETWYKMSNLLVGGLQDRLAPILTHQFPMSEFQKGFDVFEEGKAGKVVLDIQS